MPTIINGCGTWYYGKRRIHRVKAGCQSCGAFAELESYDTTLYFVVVMVPIIPLSQKRILEFCPVCQRHRIAKLKDWEKGKAEAFGSVLEKLQANPNDRETIQSALGLATVYQDEAAFDKLADVLAGHRTDDAEIQSQLGAAYEYFSRWADAERAYSRAYAVAPDDNLRERLAVCMLKQNRPEEATGFVSHTLEQKDPEKAWLSYWLIDGFMAKGMHRPALELIEIRDEAFPELAKSKAYKAQRKTAEKHLDTDKPIRSSLVSESSKTGFREGTGLGFKWPKYVAGGIFLALIALYLGVAVYRGQSRSVYLVNGWTKPYTVTVNGESHQLHPGQAKKIDIAEGEVILHCPGLGTIGEVPRAVTIETPFFSRPFNRPIFVLNPDECALLIREEIIFSNDLLPPDQPPKYGALKVLHEFEDVDYEFEEFPASIQAKAGSKITKSRVGLVPVTDTQDRIMNAQVALPGDQLAEYVKWLLKLDPDDSLALIWLTQTLPPKEGLAFAQTRLGDRPIRVEWHRVYQSLTEMAEPEKDLKPEYRKLLDETKRSAAAVYLLGRLEDGPEGDKLYEEAATAKPPLALACGGLSFRFLVRGEFEQALSWAKKGLDLDPASAVLQQWHLRALLADGKYAEILAATRQSGTGRMMALRERLTAFVATGERGAAEGEVNQVLAQFGFNLGDPARGTFRQSMDLMLAEVERDRSKYLAHAEKSNATDGFAVKVLKGDYKGAALVPTGAGRLGFRDWEFAVARPGLLYLAGMKEKDAAFADEQWKKFAEALNQGDREGRYFDAVANGKQPFDLTQTTRAAMSPATKRVVLAAFARKYPANKQPLERLAKKLDFERDEVSLCLRYLME